MRNVMYSVFEYRPNPSQPEKDRIPLGIVMEVVTPKWIVIALRARSFLTPGELALLDGIGRDLLKSPNQFLKSEIEELLYEPRRPGEILVRLANKHEWSIHITEPKKREVKVPAGVSARDAVDYALDDVFGRVMVDPAKAPVGKHGKRKNVVTAEPAISPSQWTASDRFEAQAYSEVRAQ